jgi:hypothetical protein
MAVVTLHPVGIWFDSSQLYPGCPPAWHEVLTARVVLWIKAADSSAVVAQVMALRQVELQHDKLEAALEDPLSAQEAQQLASSRVLGSQPSEPMISSRSNGSKSGQQQQQQEQQQQAAQQPGAGAAAGAAGAAAGAAPTGAMSAATAAAAVAAVLAASATTTLLYAPAQLVSPQRKSTQILLYRQLVRELQQWFNQQHAAVGKQRAADAARVAELAGRQLEVRGGGWLPVPGWYELQQRQALPCS